MKKIKIASAAIVLAAGTIGAFAFTNANNEVKSAEVEHTYFVTGKSGSGASLMYNVQTGSQICEGTQDPCEIRSTATPDPDGNIPESSVTRVVTWQPEL